MNGQEIPHTAWENKTLIGRLSHEVRDSTLKLMLVQNEITSNNDSRETNEIRESELEKHESRLRKIVNSLTRKLLPNNVPKPVLSGSSVNPSQIILPPMGKLPIIRIVPRN